LLIRGQKSDGSARRQVASDRSLRRRDGDPQIAGDIHVGSVRLSPI
jgi:hypothetical protein